MSYFVVLKTDTHPIPLVDGAYQLRVFDTEEQAFVEGEKTLLGKAYGFYVYEVEEE